MKPIRLFLLLSALHYGDVSTAWAEERNTLTLGLGMMHAAVRDPEGTTAKSTGWYPEIGYQFDWKRYSSAHVYMGWTRLLTTARPGRPHADTRGLFWGARYGRRWPWTRYFHPHFHIGIEYLDMRSRERFTVDNEGFVIDSLPPRKHRGFNWLLGISYHLDDYGWGGWVLGVDWHDPFGLSGGLAGGVRVFVRYQIRFD